MKLLSRYPPTTRGKIIVWGLLASYPFGGMTWQVLHYLSGLKRLGFDVWYVEDSDNPLQDPQTLWHTPDYTKNIEYLSFYMNSLGMEKRWLFRPPGEPNVCLGAADACGLARLYAEVDGVINLCGAHYLRPEHSEIDCLIYLQTDPLIDQVRIAKQESWLIDQLDSYSYLFTYGENIGNDDCLIPVERYQWRTTRPPVCLNWWSDVDCLDSNAKLTTISTWKNFNKDIVWQGENYSWRKDSEFQRFIDLPSHSRIPIELALEGINDLAATEMRQSGWQIISAKNARHPAAYRQYICSSWGEFTVTKEQYVRSRSGWFSDRSVCYLAAGRPVITQETGFSKFLPTGKGLFAFKDMEDILAAIEAIASDYEGNCRAARDIATEYFAAEKVIGKLMEQAGF